MSYDLRKLDVLVVEKHNAMRSIVKRVLSELGIKAVRDTSDPELAFKAICSNPADLILTDWAPGLDGMTLLHKVRTDPQSPDLFVPVIVVTANTELRHVFTARDYGMTEYLAKPISAKLIYSRIRSIIERRRYFVRNKTFFGPDRRRRRLEFDGPDRRKHENQARDDRRGNVIPFPGRERRQGYDGYVAPERRASQR